MEEIKLSGLNETILHDVCDNGLNVYMWVNKKANNFYATLNVKYGAVDTEYKLKENNKEFIKEPDGIAHFLEHMMFEEPGGKTAHDYFNELGSSINAFTTFDYTCYLTMASDKFKENVDYLLDYVQRPHFTKEGVKKEKGIIVEEIKMYKDIPGQELLYKTNKCLYHKDKSKIDILGSEDSVKSIEAEDLKRVYETFYHPENMFIVITGNFNPEEALTIIKENQSKKKFSKYKNPIRKVDKEPLKVVKEHLEISQNIEIPKLRLAFKMDRKNFKNIEDLNLSIYLNCILRSNLGSTSDLHFELTKNELIVGGIGYQNFVKPEVVVIKLSVTTRYPNEIIKKLLDAMKKLKINDSFIRRAKKTNIASLIGDFDDIETINGVIQDDLVVYEKVVADYYEIFNNLDIKIAKQVIKGIKCDNYVTVIGNPKKKEKKDIEEK